MKAVGKFSRYGGAWVVLVLAFAATFGAVSAHESGKDTDWPRWRGANHDATALERGVLDFDTGQGLKLVWKKPLGSGYSSISIADGRAFTMFSDKTNDYAIAFDAGSGEELWRFEIGETYKGHDGSHDGPISTPLVANERVYGLGPNGELFALDVATGSKLWLTHLVADQQAKAPFYGFATSPILEGDVLVVETGGEGRTISGFNKDTGERLWSTGSDTVNYQSPIALDVDGETHLLCVGDKYIYGLEPQTGKLLWEYRHAGGHGSINPVTVGHNRLFLQYKWAESVVVEIKKTGEGYVAEELWKNRNIRGTYNTPVYTNGYLYGYSSRFLTCVNAETGESVWKSRKPGDGFTILVDGHLVILTKKGSLHVAKASPEGYQEMASLALFDDLAWTPASFANGKIFARSHGEIASIEVAKVDQVVAAAEHDAIAGSEFAQFLARVNAADDKASVIDEYIAAQDEFPITEGDNLVHFIFRGKAKDVVIIGDMIGFGQEMSMNRIAGTDLYTYSTRLEPDTRVNYRFTVDFENNVIDSLNSRKTQGVFGEMSWFGMPKWNEPAHLQELAEGAARGRLDSLQFESAILENSRKLDVYLPAGYDDSEQRYPVAYVHAGGQAQNAGQMVNTLDNIVGTTVSPIIVVFISQHPKTRNREYSGNLKDQYSRALVEELVPLIDRTYRTLASAEARANIGQGFPAFAAFYSTWKHPGVFSKVSGQSVGLLTAQENELKAIAATASEQPLQFYMDWGRYDIRSPLEGWDIGAANASFTKFLEQQGYACAGGEVNEGFGWASWRNRTDKIFETFFPMKNEGK